MQHSLRSLHLACWLTLIFASLSSAQEWTRFRGPNGTGLSAAANIPSAWTEQDYNWKTQLPGVGHSSPVLWGDKIFLTSSDEETAQRNALCLNAATGKLLWKVDYDSSLHAKHKFNSFASATPACDELHAYFVWSTPEDYSLIALTHAGKEVWRRNLGPFVSQHSCGTSPIVVGDLVILGNEQDIEGGGKSFLIAVDRKTGETKWKVDRTSDLVAYSTPCLYEPKGGPAQLIFNSKSHGVSSFDPQTGKLNWEVGGLLDKRSCTSSLFANGLFIASCGSGAGTGNFLVAIRPGTPGSENAGQVVYKISKTSAPYVPTPIAVLDLLFLYADGGVITCLKAATGETLWTKRPGGNFFGSPVCVGDRLFCINVDGTVIVLAAADTYQELGRNPLGEPSHSTPAVAGGKMYLRTFSHLISIGGK